MTTNEIIRLENIRRNFIVGSETVHALRGVNFTINSGEFVTIMGTSGSGKSTLLNILGCLDTPTSGEYYLDGISVRSMGKNERSVLRNRKIGFVFQSYNLLPKTTALENVELPLMYNSSISAKERHKLASKALAYKVCTIVSGTPVTFTFSFIVCRLLLLFLLLSPILHYGSKTVLHAACYVFGYPDF